MAAKEWSLSLLKATAVIPACPWLSSLDREVDNAHVVPRFQNQFMASPNALSIMASYVETALRADSTFSIRAFASWRWFCYFNYRQGETNLQN